VSEDRRLLGITVSLYPKQVQIYAQTFYMRTMGATKAYIGDSRREDAFTSGFRLEIEVCGISVDIESMLTRISLSLSGASMIEILLGTNRLLSYPPNVSDACTLENPKIG
jgi:hypothetical protein